MSMIGKTLGHYEITSELGKGGMGVVYKAHDTHLDRSVAIKVLSAEKVADPDRKRRFIQEAKAASALNHPNIVTIYDIDQSDGTDFIAMEYLSGKTLDQLIPRNGMQLPAALKYALQIADALAKAHAAGIVHRDLKPSNIMVSDDGTAKILDFGLAKLTERIKGDEFASTASANAGEAPVTEAGVVFGTAAYMSPEQAEGRAVDPRSDIFSFGSMFYEMITGQRAFQGDTKISTMLAILNKEPTPLSTEIPHEVEKTVIRCLRKDPAQRYQSTGELRANLQRIKQDSDFSMRTAALMAPKVLWRSALKPRIAIPGILILAALVFSSVWYIRRQAKINWARNTVLPEIERLVRDGWQNNIEAFDLARKAEAYIPDDPKLADLLSRCSVKSNIQTTPEGAQVYLKPYKTPQSGWNFVGVTPIKNLRLANHFYQCKIDKAGFETEVFIPWSPSVYLTNSADFSRVLHKAGSIPAGMVYVSGGKDLGDFFIDKYEVTNRQYKEFVDHGGYLKREYWKNRFIKDKKELSWEQEMKEFVDQTGRPGPSTWNSGTYPNGRDDWPVNGVSWYEAAAYAEFAGKELPTASHWLAATGVTSDTLNLFHVLIPQSNFHAEEPEAVGKNPGITFSGAYDMAGNVREWCWNEVPNGRCVRGGAWNDGTYLITIPIGASALDRSPRNGFRCVRYVDRAKISATAFELIKPGSRTYDKVKPASDAVFRSYRNQFSYDATDLKAVVENKKDQPEWITEKISFDAAYPGERMQLFLFLPKNAAPPYQAVIYFPGMNVAYPGYTTENLEERERETIRMVVTSRRAFVYPIYLGTFGRNKNFPDSFTIIAGEDTHHYVELLTLVIKDFKRSIDYLETRQDIDSTRLAYYGFSWGSCMGAVIPAVDERLKTSVLVIGGFLRRNIRPEMDQINYVTRVKVPTLMLNGKYDVIGFPYETTVKPMFDLLGTPKEHKRIVLYETDHFVSRNDLIKEMDAWLDKYLGRPQ